MNIAVLAPSVRLALTLTLALTLALTPVLNASTNDGVVEEGAAEVITRLYDLGGLQRDAEGEQARLAVLPFGLTRDWDELWDDDLYAEEYSLGGMLGTLLWDVLASDEFSLETREVELLDDGRLLLTASQGIHDEFDALLANLTASFRRAGRVQVDVFAVHALPTEALDSERLDTLVAQGRVERLATRIETLVLGRTSVHRSERSHTMLRDWDTEIAHGAVAGDPQMQEWTSGSLSALRLEDDLSGGFRLRFFERHSDPLDAGMRIEEMHGTVTTEQGIRNLRSIGNVDQPVVAMTTLAGARRLAPGDDCIVSARGPSSHGPTGRVVRFRLLDVDPAPEAFALREGSEEIRVIDVSALRWRSMDVPAVTLHQMWPRTFEDYETLAIQPIHFPGSDWNDDWSGRNLVEGIVLEDSAHSFWEQYHGWMLMSGDVSALDRGLEAMRLFAPDTEPFAVEVTLRARPARGGEGATLARVTLTVDAGQPAFAMTGVTSTALYGYDVDVAQNASTGDPSTVGYLDGLAVRASKAGPDGVRIDVCLNALASREKVDFGSSSVGPMDRLTFDTLELSREVLADGREHRITGLGGASAGAAGEIVLRVTRP